MPVHLLLGRNFAHNPPPLSLFLCSKRAHPSKKSPTRRKSSNRLQTRQPSTPSRSWHGWRWCNTCRPKKRIKSLRAGPSPAQIWPLPADTVSAAVQRTKRDMAPKLSLYTDLGHQYWSWGAWVRSHTTKTHQIIGTSVSAAHMHICELVITTASSASIHITNPHTLSSPVYQGSSIRSRIFKT